MTTLSTIANTIRGLSMDAIQAANSGHPGLPMGCAEIGASLFSEVLNYNPDQPQWLNRDRFILSAGHGSMLLYSLLHLSGYKVSLEEIKNFRQYGAHTAGHPEYSELPGIETTTGPLGQGIATGIGMSLAQKITAATYKLTDLLDHKIYILAGDGCMMEGISSEASSLAGHLQLNNIVLIYDANDICLDGPLSECMSEDVAMRYKAYGWEVITLDGHCFESLSRAFQSLKNQQKPTLIIAKTTIGKGSPSYQGSSEIHGKALGAEEVSRAKKYLNIPESPTFFIPNEVTEHFKEVKEKNSQRYNEWLAKFTLWETQNPELATALKNALTKTFPDTLEATINTLVLPESTASRQASGIVIQALCKEIPYIIGGSADLSGSDNTMIKNGGIISSAQFEARNIKYGVREFAMGAMASGLALYGTILPFCGTFLTFSDYMKNAIRLAALMKLPVIYQFTHDSIFLGEDGPTHQPVEHLAALRAMPELNVIRPGDATEVKGAWLTALKSHQPTAIILSRQALPTLSSTRIDGVARGAYVLKRETQPNVDVCIMATGSELTLANEIYKELTEKGLSIRLVSFPSFEQFEKQDATYKNHTLNGTIKLYVSIEAQSSFGWHKYIGRDGLAIAVDQFGLSAPAKNLATHFGFTKTQIIDKINHRLSNLS